MLYFHHTKITNAYWRESLLLLKGDKNDANYASWTVPLHKSQMDGYGVLKKWRLGFQNFTTFNILKSAIFQRIVNVVATSARKQVSDAFDGP